MTPPATPSPNTYQTHNKKSLTMPALVTLPHPARFLAYLALILGCLLFSSINQAQDIFDTPKQSGLDTSILAPDDEFLLVTEAFQLQAHVQDNQLVLEWTIAPAYYLYEERFKLSASNGITLRPQFGAGITKYDEFFAKDMTVFYDKAVLTVDLPPDTAPFNLQVESQGCADAGLCYPPYTDYLQVNPENNQVVILPPPEDLLLVETPPTATTEAPNSLIKIMLFAILGGIILNLMPCVFPVLSIKVMSLAQADRDRLPLHGWVYTAGIVACFVAFAGALLLARAGGEAIGWGFQLQSPLLIAALTYLFFVMGLSMSGMINIGTRWMGAGQSLTQKSGLSGSFFTGVLAAVVASPCTAPFMGAALGFALTQPTIVCLAIFAALGLGMALPLLLLCYLPALANRLPKPGVWMENLKEFLAFPLYLTAVWLLWVLGRQAGVDASMIVAAGAVAIAFGCWLLNRSAHGAWQWLRRALIAAAWISALVMPWQMIGQTTEPSRWQAYSPERLQQLRASGTPVFVNLTADWCLTCLANERLTLHTEEVEQAFDDYQVVTLKGDWTNRDPQITALLTEYGRSGVPLYLWFPAEASGKAEILPQLLTPGRLIESISGHKTAFNN